MHQHGVAASIDLAGFVLLGLIGSVAHCTAMCSPFVLFVSSRFARGADGRAVMQAQGWYAAGRVATYAGLGAIAGALGSAFQIAGSMMGVHRVAAAFAGAVLVASALAGLFRSGWSIAPHGGWFGAITRRLQQRVPSHPFFVGSVLGLLPCGLIYTAVVAAVARGSALSGAVALLLFGLGTVPALAGVALANEVLFRRGAAIQRASQVFVLIMGLWYLWRGLV